MPAAAGHVHVCSLGKRHSGSSKETQSGLAMRVLVCCKKRLGFTRVMACLRLQSLDKALAEAPAEVEKRFLAPLLQELLHHLQRVAAAGQAGGSVG